MKIADFQTERHNSRVRIAATVTWEDCERPSHDVYFESESHFADFSFCNPDAFLLPCAIPAMHYGEKGVLVEEAICPALRNGVTTALGWLRHWFSPGSEPLRIEGPIRSHDPAPPRPDRAGFMFSGGIDSFSMLRRTVYNFRGSILGQGRMAWSCMASSWTIRKPSATWRVHSPKSPRRPG